MKKLIGEVFTMPEPNIKDSWKFGNFDVTVIDIVDGLCIVEDQDSDTFIIDYHRVKFILLQDVVKDFMAELAILGCDDEHADIRGSDCVDTVCNHYPAIIEKLQLTD